jgi:hypothetical protein
VIEIPFRAIPADASKRIGLTLTYNGQTVHRAYEVGPAGRRKARSRPLSVTRMPPRSRQANSPERSNRCACSGVSSTRDRAGT